MTPFMSFGKMPIANGIIEKKDFDNEFFFNMNKFFFISAFLLLDKNHKPSFLINYPF